MGFFSELKEDLSQAVNELVPEEELEIEKKAEEIIKEEALLEKAEADFEEELNGSVQEEVKENPFQNMTDSMEVKGVISDEVSTITKNMIVNGDLEANGSLDLFGTVNGDIKILGKLNVTGNITGNSEAAEVYAQNAKVSGNITSMGSVKIGSESVIRGNIFATSAVIAGAVKGDIDVKGPVVLDASAIVMGNIKSKSVQINNGAVIEGLCSQCYAEVSPSNFFRD